MNTDKIREKLQEENDRLAQSPINSENIHERLREVPDEETKPSRFGGVHVRPFEPHVGIGQDRFSQYDKHIRRPRWSRRSDDIEELRAKGQSGWGRLGNSLSQAIGGQIIGGTIANVGYLFDFPSLVKQLEGAEHEWGDNLVSRLGNQIQKKFTEDWTPIHQTKRAQQGFALSDGSWWFSMAPSIFSSASLLIPVLGTTQGIRLAGRALGVARNLGPTAAHRLQTVGSAFLSRHMYSTTESYELFEREKERYMREHDMTEKDARKLASEAAAYNYKWGYANLWKDVLAWGMVLRGFNPARAGINDKFRTVAAAKTAEGSAARKIGEVAAGGTDQFSKAVLTSKGVSTGKYIHHALLEGFEEYNIQWQKAAGEKRGRRLAGHLTPEEEAMTNAEFMIQHTKDRHTWDSFFWGFMGGMTFGGLTRVGARVFNTSQAQAEDMRIQGFVERSNYFRDETNKAAVAAANNDIGAYNASMDNLVLGLANRGASEGTLALDIEMAQIVSQMNEQQLAEAGFSPESSIEADKVHQKLIKFEQIYNKHANKAYGTKNDAEVASQLAILEYKADFHRGERATNEATLNEYINSNPAPTGTVSEARQLVLSKTKLEALKRDITHLRRLHSDVSNSENLEVRAGLPIIDSFIKAQQREIKTVETEVAEQQRMYNEATKDNPEVNETYVNSLPDEDLIEHYNELERSTRALEHFENNLLEFKKPEVQQQFVEDVESRVSGLAMRFTEVWEDAAKSHKLEQLNNVFKDMHVAEVNPKNSKDVRSYEGEFEMEFTKADGTGIETALLKYKDVIKDKEGKAQAIEADIVSNDRKKRTTIRINPDGTTSHNVLVRWANPRTVKTAREVRLERHKRVIREVYGDQLKEITGELEASKIRLENSITLQNMVRSKLFRALKNVTQKSRISLKSDEIRKAVQEAIEQDLTNKSVAVLSISQLERLKEYVEESYMDLKTQTERLEGDLTKLREYIDNFELDTERQILEDYRKVIDENNEAINSAEEEIAALTTRLNNMKRYLKGLHTRMEKFVNQKVDLEVTMDDLMREAADPEAKFIQFPDNSIYSQELSKIREEIKKLQERGIANAIEKIRLTEEQIQNLENDMQQFSANYVEATKRFNKIRGALDKFINKHFGKPKEKKDTSKPVTKDAGDRGGRNIEAEIEADRKVIEPPMQPLLGKAGDLSRSTANQVEYINTPKDKSTFEPQLLFQEFADTYNINLNPSSPDFRSVDAYSKKVLLKRLGDSMPKAALEHLRNEDPKYDNTVYLVVVDRDRNPVKVKSFLDSSRESVMFAPMNGVNRNERGTPINKRFTSSEQQVSLRKEIERQKEFGKTQREAEMEAQRVFEEFSERYQRALDQLLASPEPTPMEIREITPGATVNLELKEGRYKDIETKPAGETLVHGDGNLGNVRILVSTVGNYVTINNIEYYVGEGHVAFEHKGRAVMAERMNLNPDDISRVTKLLQLAMLKDIVGDIGSINKAINSLTYLYFTEKKAREVAAEGQESDFRFYVKSAGTGNNAKITSVQFGNSIITKSELLNPEANREKIEQLQNFLATKYYNVDAKAIEEFQAGRDFDLLGADLTIKDGKVVSGDLVTERTYTQKEGGYNAYLLHSSSPKLMVRLNPLQEDRLDANSVPQFINRSVRALPVKFAERVEPVVKEREEAPTARRRASDLTSIPLPEPTKKTPMSDESRRDIESTTERQVGEEMDAEIEGEVGARQALESSKLIGKIHEKQIEESTENLSSEDIAGIQKILAEGIVAEERATEPKTEDKKIDPSKAKFMFKPGEFDALRIARGERGATQAERERALTVLKQILPDSVFSVVRQNVLGNNVDASLHNLRDHISIMVSESAAPFSEAHEAFHAVSLLFTTPSERTALYNELRNVLKGQKVRVQDGKEMVTKVGDQLTDKQAEEFLAEEFRYYVMQGKDAYQFGKYSIVKKNIFERIWNAIVDLLLGRGMHLDKTLGDPAVLINKFQEVLSSQYYTADRVERSNIAVDKIGTYSIKESEELVRALNHVFFKTLHSDPMYLKTYQNANVLKDAVYGKIETIDGVERPTGVMAHLYSLLKAYNNTSWLESLTHSDKQKVIAQAIFAREALNNWTALKQAHSKYLSTFDVSFKAQEFNEFDRGRNTPDWIEGNRIDSRTQAPPALKLLIAGLTKLKIDNRGRAALDLTSMGTIQTVDYGRTIGILHRELANVHDPVAMVEKLETLAETKYPEFDELLDKLGINSSTDILSPSLSLEQFNLQSMFFIQMHKSINDYITQVVTADGHIYHVDAVSSTLENQIIDRWKNTIKTGVENNISISESDVGRLFPDMGLKDVMNKKKAYDQKFKRGFANVFRKDKQGRYILNSEHKFPIGQESRVADMPVTNISARTVQQTNSRTENQLIDYVSILNAFGITIAPNKAHEADIIRAVNALGTALNKAIRDSKRRGKGYITAEDIFNRDIVKINKELKELAGLQAKESTHFIDNQIVTSKGTEYALMEKNNMGKLIDALNSGEIPRVFQAFDPNTGLGNITNPILPESIYGVKDMMSSHWLTYSQVHKGRIGKSILRNVGREVGDKIDINEAKPSDYRSTFINAVLTGNFPLIRAAERGLEYAFNFPKEFVDIVRPADLNVNPGNSVYVKRLKGYLFAEMLSALAMRSNPAYQRLVKSRNIKGLSYFKEILPDIDKLIESGKYDSTDSTMWWTNAEEILTENNAKIEAALVEHIKSERVNTISDMLSNEVIIPEIKEGKDTGNFAAVGISSETLSHVLNSDSRTISKGAVETLADVLNLNTITAFIEQTKLVTGDPAMYLKLSKTDKTGRPESELFKRTTTFASTISGALNHDAMINYLNVRYKRMDGHQHNKVYKDFVIKDVNVESKYHPMLEAVLGKEAARAYKKMTENDAQGWATLDGDRSLQLRTGKWTERKEMSYQYEAQLLAKHMVDRGMMTWERFEDIFSDHLPEEHQVAKGVRYYHGMPVDLEVADPLAIQKPQGTGFFENEGVLHAGKPQITKTGLASLRPSDFVHNPAVMDYIADLAMNGVDFVFPESAKKGEILGNTEGEIASLYDSEGNIIPVTEHLNQGFILEEISWNSIGDQVNVDPEGHRMVTKSTQDRRLSWVDIFDSGEMTEAFSTPELQRLHTERTELERWLVDKGLNTIAADLGYTLKEGTESDYNLQDIERFRNTLVNEFHKRTMPANVLDGIDMVLKTSVRVIEALPTKRQVTNVLQGLIRSNAVSIQVHGDMLVQQANTLFEVGKRDISFSNDLKFYIPLDKDGNEITDPSKLSEMVSVGAMEVMIPLPKQWIKYIESAFSGETFEVKLDAFNKAMINENTPTGRRFKDLRNLSGNRIPTGSRNTIEAMKVVRYLHPLGGPRIIMPSEIVAKAGSDFDIDKLTVYIPNYAKERDNNVIIPVKYNAAKKSKRGVENRLIEINREITLHKNNFESLIKPNDSEIIRQSADKIAPAFNVSNHRLLSYTHNVKIADQYWQANALVAALALNNVAHATTQESPVRFDSRIIRRFIGKRSARETLYMGHIKDSEGNNISGNINAALNASVDAQKEASPAIFRINLTMSTINAYMALNRLGSKQADPTGFRELTRFFTLPVVIDFENSRRIKESTIVNAAGERESKRNTALKTLKDHGDVLGDKHKFLYESFAEFMRVDHRFLDATQHQELVDQLGAELNKFEETYTADAKNRNVAPFSPNHYSKNPTLALEVFLYNQEVGKIVNQFQTVTRPDAGLPADRSMVKVSRIRKDQLKATEVIVGGDIDSYINNTFLSAFQNSHDASLNMFTDFYLAEKDNRIDRVLWGDRGLVKIFTNPAMGKSTEDIGKIMNKLEMGMLTYIAHTIRREGRFLNRRYTELAHGPNSLPKRFPKIKRLAEDNLFLEELTPMVQEYIRRRGTTTEIDYFSTFSRTLDINESDNLVESVRELLDHENPEVSQFARDLIEMSLIQSGLQASFTSFFELLPAEAYYPVVSDMFQRHMDKPFEVTPKMLDSIFANLSHDRDIIPLYTHRLYKSLKDSGMRLIVPKEHLFANYPYLAVELETISKREAKQFREEGLPIPKKLHLYKEYAPLGENVEYRQIDNFGDGPRFQEHYVSESRKSLISTNHISPTQRTESNIIGDEGFAQIQSKPEELVRDARLDKATGRFLNKIGVEVNNIDYIFNRMGEVVGTPDGGVVAIANISKRTVDVIEGRADRMTLPEEAAHFYVELLPKSDPLYKRMSREIKNYKIYEDVQRDYGQLYQDNPQKILHEAMAKAVASVMTGQPLVETTGAERSQLANWFRALWGKIKQIFNMPANSFQRAAYDVMNQNVERFNTKAAKEVETSEEYYRSRTSTEGRLEMLDDVYMARKKQQEMQERREQESKKLQESIAPTKPTKETEPRNKQELRKVEDMDFAKSELLTNFEKYFPAYENFNMQERQDFIDMMSEGQIEIYC